MPEQEARNLLSMHGIEVPPRPVIIPERFQTRISDKVSGIVYRDPLSDHHEIRVMVGKIHSPNPAQRGAYIKVKMHGQTYDKYGKIIKDGAELEGHIPYCEFNPEIFLKEIK